jgi:hypothetical protein
MTTRDETEYVAAVDLVGALTAACTARIDEAEEAGGDAEEWRQARTALVRERSDLRPQDRERVAHIRQHYPARLRHVREAGR